LKILYVGKFEDQDIRERNEELTFFVLSKIIEVDKFHIRLKSENEIVKLSQHYDWILFSTPCIYVYDPSFLDKLKCKSALWVYDWMWGGGRESKFIPFAKKCDVVFTTDNMVDWGFYGINHHCLRQGIDPRVHYKVEPDPFYESYVAFTGHIYSRKRRVLARMLYREFGDKFRIWDTLKYRNDLPAWKSREIFRKICASTKVLVGDKLFDGVKEYWSNRVYITLGCGGFLIQEYIKGIEKEFENKKHFVLVSDPTQLADYIHYYIEHPIKRETIANQGYIEVVKNHTYEVRVRELIKILKEN